MKYDNIIKEFIASFPEIERLSNQEILKWKDEESPEPPAHVFFGNVLNLFLVEELKIMKNNSLLERIFHFLELMATSGNEDVRGILTATVLEYLGDDKEILTKARSLMGKETLKLSHEVEKTWGRE
jgi:hypothetical protein